MAVQNNLGGMYNNDHSQNKAFHANLIFERWRNREIKTIKSLHTGISYNSRYMARNHFRNITAGRIHMYHKLLNGFRFSPSPNPKTATKQKQRFECSVRRVLKDETIKPGGITGRTDVIVAKFAWNFSGKLRIIGVNCVTILG
ncbi:hypothetical protein GLOIN_2v1883394 [Rhizophagus irregularis DAOM 181602=DAOM 197198]|nr:hypothetical protein RirG_132480 [Rhizophagus irregularis DAOM 197198w]GET57212.1 hypothetical protein GLOIN_2v1883394 [Rhizophagus irregularis DAOM 181602=DAOM 197198]